MTAAETVSDDQLTFAELVCLISLAGERAETTVPFLPGEPPPGVAAAGFSSLAVRGVVRASQEGVRWSPYGSAIGTALASAAGWVELRLETTTARAVSFLGHSPDGHATVLVSAAGMGIFQIGLMTGSESPPTTAGLVLDVARSAEGTLTVSVGGDDFTLAHSGDPAAAGAGPHDLPPDDAREAGLRAWLAERGVGAGGASP